VKDFIAPDSPSWRVAHVREKVLDGRTTPFCAPYPRQTFVEGEAVMLTD